MVTSSANTSNDTFTTTTPTTVAPDATSPTPAQTLPSSARHDIDCHLTSMTVHIPVSLAPNARLILRDPKCVLINNGTHYVITFAYDTCGTSMTFYEDYMCAENDVTVHVEVNGGSSVVFDSDYKIPIVCQTVASHKVEGSFQTWTREPIKEESTDLTVSSFVLREFKTSLYQEEITKSPVKIPLNREMYVELALNNSMAKSFGVKVNQCIATPSSDPSDPIRFELINNGCAATQAVHIQDRPAPDRYRFSVQAFRFQGDSNQDNLVFIHCDVGLCPILTCDVTCDGRRRTRKRRNLRLNKSSVTLTSRPHLVVNHLD